jgi:uncharacterized protein YjbJ (UPF0337 family)
MIVVLFSDEGARKSVGGKAAGKIMSDSKMQAEGKLDCAARKAQNTVGGIKDKVEK